MRRLLPLLASLVLLALPSAAHAYTFYEWDTAAPPRGLGLVGDTLYFGQPSGQLGQSTLRGVQSAVEVSGAAGIAAFTPGPAGTDLWFADEGADRVGRITPGEPPVLLPGTIEDPLDLAAGPDGNIWVVTSGGEVVCVTTAGASTPHPAPAAVEEPVAIAAGRDGALWFVDTAANRIGRLAPGATCADAPTITDYALPENTAPVDITVAPTGTDLYVAGTNGLVRVTAAGAGSTIAGTGEPTAVASDAAGVWWVDAAAMRIGRHSGATTTEWALPRASGAPSALALAGDGSVWYVSESTGRIGRFSEETGPQGPGGSPGGQGPQGPAGQPGGQGPQGPAGQPGGQGPKGDPGASIQGSPGPMGPMGPSGPRGATGATGERGATGRRGKTGPAAKIPRISCRLTGGRVSCRVAKGRRGGGGGGTGGGTNSGGGEGLRLRLSRSKKLYATGSRAARSQRKQVRLHTLRRVKPGRYTLAIDVGDDVTVRIRLTLR